MTERKTQIRNLLIVVMIMFIVVMFVTVNHDTTAYSAKNTMSVMIIEDIQVGDKILARNDNTGEVEENEVTETFVMVIK